MAGTTGENITLKAVLELFEPRKPGRNRASQALNSLLGEADNRRLAYLGEFTIADLVQLTEMDLRQFQKVWRH